MFISIILRVRTISHEAFLKIGVSFDGMLRKKEVFSESSHHIEKHLDVVVEIIEVQVSVSFYLCIGEEIMEFWLSYLMF